MDLTFGILLTNLTIIAGIWYLSSRAGRTSRGFWVFLLYGVQIGPQTVVEIMTRTDLFYSGLRFITWGLIFFSVWVVNVVVMDKFSNRVEPHNFFVLVVVLSTLFSAMSFVKALYFLVRSVLRRKEYVPPSIQERTAR